LIDCCNLTSLATNVAGEWSGAYRSLYCCTPVRRIQLTCLRKLEWQLSNAGKPKELPRASEYRPALILDVTVAAE